MLPLVEGGLVDYHTQKKISLSPITPSAKGNMFIVVFRPPLIFGS